MYQDFDEEIYRKARIILKGLKAVCLDNREKMYLANSRDLIALILDLNLIEFWPTLKFDKQLLKIQSNHLQMNSAQLQLQNEIEKD